ncbi:3D domain-containing protein [Lysinibacillus sp. NPDC097287]|uniref:LysM peptidoglycan-binding and 3D domain-containing protein n=1 Tax=Lysinibacillus sp. NPDC097287 TaxID=3364144 RepID=UPI0037F2F261
MKKQAIALAVALTLSIGMFASPSLAQEVKQEDTLWQISKNYDLSVEELQQLNALKSTISNSKQKLPADGNYLIKQGDTLFSIAKIHGVTVGDLITWNNLSSNLIYTDETLAVKASAAKTKRSTVARSTSKATPSKKPVSASAGPSPSGKTYTMRATAYTAYCKGCSGITANGTDLRSNPNQKVIAVDPRVIPLGTKVWVEGYGEAIAADTGGAIKGNKIDVFIPSDGQARNWGVRTVTLKVLN